MRKFTIILTVLIALTIIANAQIPNSGFENWSTIGSYEEPTFWGSTNSYSTGPFYAITKSTDHYPVSVGNYSVRIENNTALLPNQAGRGFLATGQPPPSPDFPIIGHPASLTGYYKFAPLNGDALFIFIQLYDNGLTVSTANYTTSASASSWTPFNIILPPYTTADGGSIFFAAYNADGPGAEPLGNSVLYVDNLNFDNFIMSISEQTSENTTFTLYPNPASDIVTLNMDNFTNADMTLNIYNVIGNLVKSEILIQNQRQINIGDLSNGIYVVEIKSKEWTEKQKLLIQR